VSDLLASFQINPVLPALAVDVPLRAAPVAVPGRAVPARDFDTAIASLLAPATQSARHGKLQDSAGGGTALPDADEPASEGPIVWLPAMIQTSPTAVTPEEEVASAAAPALSPPARDLPLLPEQTAHNAAPNQPILPAEPTGTMPGADDTPAPSAPQADPAAIDLGIARAQAQPILLPPSFTVKLEPTREALATRLPTTQSVQAPTAAPSDSSPTIAQPPLITMSGGLPLTQLPAGTPSAAPTSPPVSAPATLNAPHPIVPASTGTVSLSQPTAAPHDTVDGATANDSAAMPRNRFEFAVKAGDAPAPASLVPLHPPVTAPTLITSGAAAQVFATALSAAAIEPQRPEPAADAALLLAANAPAGQRLPVQALSPASNGMLDLARDDWPAQMIDRIAALRDSTEAADTRIKLAPENLGALEVSIRRDGDRIHVHFTAENPAARQLIAEAAPRLSELADARGVKLGQTSVDSGSQQGSQGQPQQRQPSQASTSNISATRAEPVADQRIA
jgi:flagellar hook-length control protein FliK